MRTYLQAQVDTEEKEFYVDALKLYNKKTGQSLKRREFILKGIDELLRKEGLLHRYMVCLKDSKGNVQIRIHAEKAQTREEAKKSLSDKIESFQVEGGAKLVLCDREGNELETLKE